MMLLFGTAGLAKADDWCYKHAKHQQHELDEAIRDHGYHSWQADRERRKLDQIRDECRYHADRDRYRDHTAITTTITMATADNQGGQE